MMATLAVQEAMGLKVDREAVATLVLPQLWAMCIGPRTYTESCSYSPIAHLMDTYSNQRPTIRTLHVRNQKALGAR